MKQEQPLFFLFTCVKEGRPYIQKLFSTLLAQTKINFIHYIYEDGSSDPIGDLVEEYKKQVSLLNKPYEVIYECQHENIGLNMATQHCIDKCSCRYFIWIDCDNWVDKNFFKNLEKTIYKYPGKLIYRTRIFHISDVIQDPFSESKYKKLSIKEKYAKYCLLTTTKYYNSFFAIDYQQYTSNKRCNLINVRWFYNDVQVLYFCINKGFSCAYSPKSIGYYYFQQTSEGHSFTSEWDKIPRYKSYENLTGDKTTITECENIIRSREIFNNICSFLKKGDLKNANIAYQERLKLANNKYMLKMSNVEYPEIIIKLLLKMRFLSLLMRFINKHSN